MNCIVSYCLCKLYIYYIDHVIMLCTCCWTLVVFVIHQYFCFNNYAKNACMLFEENREYRNCAALRKYVWMLRTLTSTLYISWIIMQFMSAQEIYYFLLPPFRHIELLHELFSYNHRKKYTWQLRANLLFIALLFSPTQFLVSLKLPCVAIIL
jgi:hypothetical protein